MTGVEKNTLQRQIFVSVLLFWSEQKMNDKVE